MESYRPETTSAPGQSYFNRLATIPVPLIPGLDHDHAQAGRDSDAMEIPGERLLVAVVVQQFALAKDRTVPAPDAKSIRVSGRRVVRRRHRDVAAIPVKISPRYRGDVVAERCGRDQPILVFLN